MVADYIRQNVNRLSYRVRPGFYSWDAEYCFFLRGKATQWHECLAFRRNLFSAEQANSVR